MAHSISYISKIQFARLANETKGKSQALPVFDISMGLLRSRPLFVVLLEDVLHLLKMLYPTKVSRLPSDPSGHWYILCGNHRYTAGLELKISQFWVQRLVVNPKTCAPMTGIILRKIEMSDNVIETKTLTNVSAIQRLLHLAEIVQCFFAENKKTPTFKELKEMTLVDFEDAPDVSDEDKM